jgi:general secretion pathway protein G
VVFDPEECSMDCQLRFDRRIGTARTSWLTEWRRRCSRFGATDCAFAHFPVRTPLASADGMRTRTSRACLSTRPRQRGLTLVELIVVVTLIGLLTAAIAVGVMNTYNDGRIKTAKIACNQLRTAVQTHFVNHPEESDCPTPAGMQEARELDAAMSIRDPWGTPYAVDCQVDEVVVISAGPDRKFGTEDDLRAPVPRRAAGIASSQP